MSTLLVSLSGLTDADDADRANAVAFAAELDRRGVPLTHLVQPKGPDGPLRRRDDLVRWIAGRVGAGDDVLLHGYDHTTYPTGTGGVGGFARRTEFGALPRHEAGLRLTAARRVLAATGLSTDGFAAPRWVASEGTLEALADQGFSLCADETTLRSPAPGGPVLRARIITFRASEPRLRAAERPAGDRRRTRVMVASAGRTAARADGVVRIAVRAKDLRKPARVEAALTAIDTARDAGAVPSVHRGLLASLVPAA
ncbi:DUF2334 domain-containing protein [Pseudonocardia phyllosphaerae]|uniref:DUF2334 domain-containing protein n=1 Tax=Pseudonocardia phyllosphaerae TaxID=3390502 RepID=UPI00397C6334